MCGIIGMIGKQSVAVFRGDDAERIANLGTNAVVICPAAQPFQICHD